MTKHPIAHDIPAALDDRLAFVGTAGSGKTYNSGSAVEHLLKRKSRAIVIDPLGVWWGLRLRPDGITPSVFNVVIFGGPHGDLPINEHSGALIGEAVAGMAESCVLDLSQLGTKAAERRFMLAFLTALYRKTTGEPVHLVVDEADMFAPQKLLDKEGEAAKLLGMMETIVRRGRVKGFIPWLITQRPAVLSKDVLSQADGLVAFKLTSSQDRAAIGAWIEGQADQQEGKAILASLPGLERGQGVIWLPGHQVLRTEKFPEKATYDSSRTPKRGEQRHSASLQPLNLDKLRERLATVEASRAANDPKALKAEVATLKGEIAQLRKSASAAPAVDPRVIEKEKQESYAAGIASGRSHIRGVLSDFWREVNALHDKFAKEVERLCDKAFDESYKPTKSNPVSPAASKQPASAPAIPAPRPSAASDGYSVPQQKILASLMFWQSTGEPAPTREQVAAVAGYAPGSGNFNNILGSLKSMGAVSYPTAGKVECLVAYGDAPTPEQAKATLLDKVLGGPHRKILLAMKELPSPASRDQIAEESGYAAGSGNFNNLLGKLRTLSVIDYPQQGYAEITYWANQLLKD